MKTVMSKEYHQYVESRKVQRLTPESKYRYLRTVNSFLRYVDGDISREKVLEYFDELGKKHSPNYIRWEFQVLRGFFGICGKKIDIHQDDLPREVEPKRPYLETSEAEKLLKMAQGDVMGFAMWRLLLILGIRKAELIGLNIGDYNPPNVVIMTKKHGEMRVRTLDVETIEAVNNYINGPRKRWEKKLKGKDSPLFVSPTGRRFPDSTLTKYFRRYMILLGKPKGCGIHSLRRTCVTWESIGGMDSMRLQKLHGWKSSRMPEVYSRLKPEMLEREAYGVNPIIKGDTSR